MQSYGQLRANDYIPAKIGSIKALVSHSDGTIWVGYKNGVIERYYQNGRFIKRWGLGCRLTCLCVVGDCVWVGLKEGSIVVMASELEAIYKWQAHDSAVYSMALVGGAVCTLGAEGSIKCKVLWQSEWIDLPEVRASNDAMFCHCCHRAIVWVAGFCWRRLGWCIQERWK